MPGQDLSWSPGWHRVKASMKRAATDPAVWGPLLAAGALQLDHADERISSSLRDNTPLFGSAADAQKASDRWRDATSWLWLGSALLSPGPADVDDWLSLKGQLLLQQAVTAKAARSMTSGLKSLTNRQRPNGLNRRSFPSGHATTSSVQAQLACYNLRYGGDAQAMSDVLCRVGQSAAVVTAWARVEAGSHYPSDVLAGWAIGRFFGVAAEAWMGSNPASAAVDLQMSRDDWLLSLRWQF